MKPLNLKAHAKINLWLHVGPKRKDGYHGIHTGFQEISLHDELQFTVRPKGIRLKVIPPVVSSRTNIVIDALEMLRKRVRIKKGMNVVLKKKIPMGAGLGGGSSDAAIALWAGWLLWQKKKIKKNYRMSKVPPLLKQCAKKLGADVPFFLKGGSATATGIGEKLKYQKSKRRRWIVLIYPKIHVSTAQAYAELDRIPRRPPKLGPGNDFEDVILPRKKKIQRAKEALQDAGCQNVLMSGSGSSVFGFVQSPAMGHKIVKRLKKKHWDVFLAHTV